MAVGPEYRFKLATYDSYVRLDFEYQSRNSWLAPVQDVRTSQDPVVGLANGLPGPYTLSARHFTSVRAGVTVHDWMISPFIDNVFNSQTVSNYALGQVDPYNPAGSPTQQQNVYVIRPRTFGITASWRL
ncbi:MAG: hypothetical protein JO173_10900 [Gammaproteobacteria bacterium]|nr:hypothetical protein [Gammaproteobacteria bacterium]